MNRYWNRWGKIRQVYIPSAVIQDGSLVLKADSLSVLIVLLSLNKIRQLRDSEPLATVRVGQKKLTELTGYTNNAITKAAKGLGISKFIQIVPNRKKRGEFGMNEYILCHPQTGEPLPAHRNVLYANKISYFTFPLCVVREREAHWSLVRLTGSELKLYASMLWIANRARSNEFQSTGAELREVSGLTRPTLTKSIDGLEERGLIWVTGNSKAYDVHLCDPYTGEPIAEETGLDEDNPANYYVIADDRRSRRFNANTGNPGQIETVVRSSLPDGEVPIVQGNGDLMIICPFHSDQNPSCSVSPSKQGCFHCFGCGKDGSLSTLIMQLRAVPKYEVIRQRAATAGAEIEYHEPDSKAIARYSYRDEKGKLLKQVLRYPDVNGKKMFLQRCPAKSGDWKWNTTDLAPMLYNMELLKYANTVCITEGEKDAETVTNLRLGSQYEVIGMTSGGANSWDDQFAKHLRGKRVVLMPDADEPGAKFAEAVKKSLAAEDIEYREVSFADAGAKDVTEFLEEHTVEELVRRIGPDWVRMPDGERLVDNVPHVDVFTSIGSEMEGHQISI